MGSNVGRPFHPFCHWLSARSMVACHTLVCTTPSWTATVAPASCAASCVHTGAKPSANVHVPTGRAGARGSGGASAVGGAGRESLVAARRGMAHVTSQMAVLSRIGEWRAGEQQKQTPAKANRRTSMLHVLTTQRHAQMVPCKPLLAQRHTQMYTSRLGPTNIRAVSRPYTDTDTDTETDTDTDTDMDTEQHGGTHLVGRPAWRHGDWSGGPSRATCCCCCCCCCCSYACSRQVCGAAAVVGPALPLSMLMHVAARRRQQCQRQCTHPARTRTHGMRALPSFSTELN